MLRSRAARATIRVSAPSGAPAMVDLPGPGDMESREIKGISLSFHDFFIGFLANSKIAPNISSRRSVGTSAP